MIQLDLKEFRKLHTQKKAEKAKLFQLEPPDPPASEQQLADLEQKLGVQLPSTYRSFLKEYGGGAFGLTNVFSAFPHSEYYAVLRNTEARKLIPENAIALSDDFCGGWYVLCFTDGVAKENIFYWNADGGLVGTEFANVLEFVNGHAYGNT